MSTSRDCESIEDAIEAQHHDETAQQLIEEFEHGSRHYGVASWLIPIVAASWSLFQLSLPYFVNIDSIYIRSVHLVFAICLVYLSYPTLKKRQIKWLPFLSEKQRIPVYDFILAVLAVCAAAYYAWDYVAISGRSGAPIPRDVVFGILLILALIEAARRALGPALPCVVCLFIFYAFFAEYAPSFIATRSVSLERLVGQLTLSMQGIYGVPLYVSASTVFLFVLFGAMLERTGGGEYFVKLAFSLLGGFKGGPAKASVLASGMTGAVSGSSIANVVTTGTFTIPLMKRCGYPAEKAAAIEVAASTNAQLMPPIMGAAAFIIAEYCGMAYYEVVRAAFIPAIIAYLGLLYITHLEASKLGLQGIPRNELPPFWKTFRTGIHFMIPLLLLLYLLIIKRYSPELSAFWSILLLLLTVAVYNIYQSLSMGVSVTEGLKLSLQQCCEGLVTGGKNMMSIGVAVAAAGIIVGIVSMGLGSQITEVVDTVARGNIYIILVLTAIASLILGMGLPTTANYIVMASLTAQVIVTLAADAGFVVPIIAAHLFCFYFGILADDTPPVGLAAYAAAAIARSEPIRTGIQGFTYDMRTAILPFMFFFNTDLLLWGVSGWHNIIAIFFTGLVGMLAFAALLQNFMFVKNRWYESITLLLVTLLLLQPLFFYRNLPLVQLDAMIAIPLDNRWTWRIVGLLLCGGIALWQYRRAATQKHIQPVG